jgi:hypothetical protein
MSAYLLHTSGPLVGLVRSQSLSPARLVFLISLVVFFTVLFIVAYVWMRKPEFGQHEGHAGPGGLPKAADPQGQSRLGAEPQNLVLPSVGGPERAGHDPEFEGSDLA